MYLEVQSIMSNNYYLIRKINNNKFAAKYVKLNDDVSWRKYDNCWHLTLSELFNKLKYYRSFKNVLIDYPELMLL